MKDEPYPVLWTSEMNPFYYLKEPLLDEGMHGLLRKYLLSLSFLSKPIECLMAPLPVGVSGEGDEL